eukprot:SAG31_NODE_1165_length_9578_cov_5.386011_11_plen_61_part_00
MQSVQNFLHTAADTARETLAAVAPVSNVSTFVDSGCLTPEVCALTMAAAAACQAAVLLDH